MYCADDSKDGHGRYAFHINLSPDTPIPLFDAASDTGKFVNAILLHPDKLVGKTMIGATAFYTPTEIAEAFSELSGRKVSYVQLPDETFKSFLPPPMAEDLTEMMILIREYGYYGKDGAKQLEWSSQFLDEKPKTIDEIFKRNTAWIQE